ncbi:hypothetical protein [Chlorogloeopsis sp. ULAP02]|uniref:hypothetical protein n=1 Tax=Chlorogloeopsis sp. ULAP02 TaxID=3107926 RepID=UPI00398AC263
MLICQFFAQQKYQKCAEINRLAMAIAAITTLSIQANIDKLLGGGLIFLKL